MKLHPYGMIYTVLYIILCKLFLETFAKKRSVSIFYTTMLLGVLSVLEYVCSVVLADFLVLKAILIIVMGTFVMMYVFGGKRSKTRRSDTVPILRYDIRSLFI